MEVKPIVANFKSGRGKGFIQNSSTNKVYESLGVSAKRETTYSIFKDKALKLNDGDNYNKYLTSLQNSNRLASLIYNNNDVDKLLQSILNQYNISTQLSSDKVILGLIEFIDMANWQSYWSDILEKIYG